MNKALEQLAPTAEALISLIANLPESGSIYLEPLKRHCAMVKKVEQELAEVKTELVYECDRVKHRIEALWSLDEIVEAGRLMQLK